MSSHGKKTKLQLGNRELPGNVLYAPLAGCSDFPFRQMSARYHPALMYCEMVKMEPLIRQDPGTLRMLEYAQEMRPIGAQLCGSNPEKAGQAAKILEELGFDVIDLNCGCPVDKITKDGSGSGMLKNPELIGEVIAAIIAAVKVPVTVKVRAGWDEQSINIAEVTKIAEMAGAVAIAVHGRTRKQAYRGPANWDWIKQSKEAATTIKVIGNGDLFSGEDAVRMFEYTACDAVLVSRGTMGEPWIVEDIHRCLAGQPQEERTLEDYKQALYDHFLYTRNYHNPRKAVLDMRRVGCWYLKKSFGARSFREKMSRVESLEDAEKLIRHYVVA